MNIRSFLIIAIVAPLIALSPSPTPGHATATYPVMRDITFVPNRGQHSADISFEVRTFNHTLFFSANAVSLHMPGRPHPITMSFHGANPQPAIVAHERQPGVVHYLLGDDPATWHRNLPTYAGITYTDLYPGIDVRYDGTADTLKGTYSVAPHADPTMIQWCYDGAQTITHNEQTGDLQITMADASFLSAMPFPIATITERAPIAWQTIHGIRRPVEVRYHIIETPETPVPSVGFTIGAYDSSYPLIIDPIIEFSTYLGGGNSTIAHAIAVDDQGNVFIAGETNAQSFPTTVNPFQRAYGGAGSEAFVTSIGANGDSLRFSTFIGGGGWDMATSLALGPDGNIYITGETDSTNFPTRHALRATPSGTCHRGELSERRCPDAFVTVLNPTGDDLIYSTLVGSDYPDRADAIAVDSWEQATIVGTTLTGAIQREDGSRSATEGAGDVFVVRLAPEGRRQVFRTLLAGRDDDRGHGVAVDEQGHTYLTGMSASDDFPYTATVSPPTTEGTRNAFVAKLDPDGAALYTTLLGGSHHDQGDSITIDVEGNAVVAGRTQSPDFPTMNPIQAAFGGGVCRDGVETFSCPDGFLVGLDEHGQALRFGTYIGGSLGDEAWDVTRDRLGNLYVTGWTESPDMPRVRPLDHDQTVRGRDAFLIKLVSDGSGITFSTLLGGSGDDYGRSVAVDRLESIYITGSTTSPDFPIRNAWSGRPSGVIDTFVTKIAPDNETAEQPSPLEHPGVDSRVRPVAGSQPPPASWDGSFADAAFRAVWERTDRPLAENVAIDEPRPWLWGPGPLSGGTYEAYAEAPGGHRLVQYFDKSRMELAVSSGAPGPWNVTNGLLVSEMIEGRIQTGATTFEEWVPSDEAIAGDPAETNPHAPTYRSLRQVASPLVAEPAPVRTNVRVITVLAADGTTYDDPFLARYNVVLRGYDQQFGHNIPDVFLAFFAQQGVVYENDDYHVGEIMDWQFVMGVPVSEPYWATVRVNGVDQDVLVQAFQRRILTYTPSNPPGFQVEMGNVGQHYLTWRYGR